MRRAAKSCARNGRGVVARCGDGGRARAPGGIKHSVAEAARAMAGEAIRSFTPDTQAHKALPRAAPPSTRDLWPTLSQWNARMAAFAQGDGSMMTRLERTDRRRGRRATGPIPRPGSRRTCRSRPSCIAETLDGGAADVVGTLEARQAPRRRVRCQHASKRMGRRVAKELKGLGTHRRGRHARRHRMRRADDRAGAAKGPAMPMRVIAVGSGALSRHLQICDIQGRPALRHFRHGQPR